MAFVLGQVEAVTIVRPYGVEDTWLKLPLLLVGQVGDLSFARDNVVSFPVMLQPNPQVRSLLDAVLVIGKAQAIIGGEKARRAE